MSWTISSTLSIMILMCCQFTCAVYLVTLRTDTICTIASCCIDCASVSWFTLVLILLISLEVAVPVSQLRVSPKKGKKLLLRHLL